LRQTANAPYGYGIFRQHAFFQLSGPEWAASLWLFFSQWPKPSVDAVLCGFSKEFSTENVDSCAMDRPPPFKHSAEYAQTLFRPTLAYENRR
jgi:hypothetical protein